ncbi:MAG: hypothetical protein D6681_03180 [Calditrichaeota bacterium]|nr:MAG: hypothetical protein D6681_03180 [Calditrichota bacterium]
MCVSFWFGDVKNSLIGKSLLNYAIVPDQEVQTDEEGKGDCNAQWHKHKTRIHTSEPNIHTRKIERPPSEVPLSKQPMFKDRLFRFNIQYLFFISKLPFPIYRKMFLKSQRF